MHGLSIFGPETLKYGPDEPFEYLNPDAPIGGKLRVPGSTFTKLNNFGLGGTGPELLSKVFDTLGIKSWDDDEPFAVYGLIAESFELSDDKSSLTVRLRPEARFADGEPLDADDVVFSYDLLFDPNVNPAARLRMANVESCEKLDDHTVRFTFTSYSRDLPISVAYLTVYPEHIYGVPGVNLAEDFNDEFPIGSGPYEIESYAYGERVVFRRRADYWANDLPVCRGFFNWERIEFIITHDAFSRLEALKSGRIDYLAGLDPITFANFGGDYFDKGYIVKEDFPLSRPSAMKCLAFNLRRPIFKDPAIRRILISLYDFDFINRNFYFGTQDRLTSYFLRQPHLRASAGPAEGAVREILLDLARRHNDPEAGRLYVSPEALEIGSYDPGTDVEGNPVPLSVRIEAANRELDRLGWKWDSDLGARRKGDDVLKFEILDPFDKGLYHYTETLAQVGIRATPSKLSPLERQNRERTFRLDMMHRWYDGRYAPGVELARHFSAEGADTPGSANLIGIENPALDEVLSVLMNSEDFEEVGQYARVFDRIMLGNAYVVPKFWPRVDQGVYWNTMGRPKNYCSGLWFTYNVMWFWWHDEEAAKRLEKAMEAGEPFVR